MHIYPTSPPRDRSHCPVFSGGQETRLRFMRLTLEDVSCFPLAALCLCLCLYILPIYPFTLLPFYSHPCTLSPFLTIPCYPFFTSKPITLSTFEPFNLVTFFSIFYLQELFTFGFFVFFFYTSILYTVFTFVCTSCCHC